jgi:mono/diheme cytochrome c family protein
MLDPETGQQTRIAGGYSLYRKHCLHCHGVSGDGNGPTAPFLWPRPRDYRPGIYKFTSTSSDKPTREDLRRTLRQGIANTSMPAFEALMTPAEIEQVLDYVIFLSLRGQTELRLVEEAAFDETQFEDPDQRAELGQMVVEQVISQWTGVDQGGLLELVQPEVARVEANRESVLRGRDLYLGLTAEKLQCAGCHGDLGKGNGPSFVPVEVFNQVVFRGKPITDFDAATQALWRDGSLDDWGEPLRPANINNGPRTDYKGGRRPVDLYRRIARGINGAKMPAHNTALKPEQIWDLVNFVLALPYEPALLETAVPAADSAPPAAGVAGGGQ